MKLLNDILSLFFINESNYKLISEHEDDRKYEIAYELEEYNIPSIQELKVLFNKFKIETKHTKDNINLQFNVINKNNPINSREKNWIINSDDTVEISDKELLNLIEYLNRYSSSINDDFYKFEIKIFITRPPKGSQNIRRIYSFDIFKEDLLSNKLNYFITEILQENSSVGLDSKSGKHIFIIDEEYKEFYTHDIFFIHNPEEEIKINEEVDITEEDIYEQLKFYNNNFIFKDNNLKISPYSFKLIQESEYEEINKLFNNLIQYISLIYLSDQSNINENILSCNIKGYTLLQIECKYPEDDLIETSLFEIFKWIYNGDKREVQLEIAKNIISLEFKKNILNINQSVLESIKSNYIIYSIDNVERYIDIKSNIIKSVSETGSTFSKSINELTSKLKNVLGLNITFFISIIIFNLIENNTENFFSFDIAVVSIFIVTGSFMFLLLNINTTVIDLYKYHNNIINIKDSYNSLITDNDIKTTIKSFYTENTFMQLQSEILYHSKIGVCSLLFILFGISILTPDIRNYFIKRQLDKVRIMV